MPMLRTTEEFLKELQYTEVLSQDPLIRLEKIGETDPSPFREGGVTPLDGIRALGLGHVIAGSGMGRDLNGDEPCSAGCTVDEYSLASLEAGALDQRGEAGHAGVSKGGSSYIIQVVGQDDDAARVDKSLRFWKQVRARGHARLTPSCCC
ncbi:hypothetical protein [Granulicella sp. S156]|uniref:hypothetical protein n=1 Tax=Granulicella sp. S156 TaxID=1747224 RepID=UPI001575C0AF|nr:hypothetical protein [Granulicella sp. S156]